MKKHLLTSLTVIITLLLFVNTFAGDKHKWSSQKVSIIFHMAEDCITIIHSQRLDPDPTGSGKFKIHCHSDDCRAIVHKKESKCSTEDCRALVNKDVNRCQSDECRAVLNKDQNQCPTPSLQNARVGFVKINIAGNCRAIITGNINSCSHSKIGLQMYQYDPYTGARIKSCNIL